VSRTTLIVLAVLVVIAVVATVLIIRRRRYVQALEGKGWTFESSPELSAVLDHRAPPFGLGFERSVDESITGRTSGGVAFHVFEYTSADGGPYFDGRLASLQLARALPALFVGQGRRKGMYLPQVQIDAPWSVWTEHPDYAHRLLSPPVRAAVQDFSSSGEGRKVDLSIDGNHLVSVGAPVDPDELEAYLEALAPVAAAIDGTDLAAYEVPVPAPAFGFFGRPDWTLVDRDDSLIDKYDLTRVGQRHRTERVVRGLNDGLPLEAFVHRWQTTRTETSTDSEGKTTTRTVTENHDEAVLAVWLPVSLPRLSLNGGWGGKRVKFELEEFNDRFAVRTSDPKFAYDVIHPRMMEFLMAGDPPDFVIEGPVMRFSPSEHDTIFIGRCADFAHELLARVPPFVWSDLGTERPRLRSAAR
jgi:hypothetical protein